jgi:VWFA-related protein
MKAGLVFLLFVSAAVAQQNVAPPVSGGNGADRRITLDVVVIDKAGKPVAGLQQQDFTVLDDKSPQKILSFHAVEAATADVPLNVILLVDAVNAGFQGVASERQEIKKFLGQNGGTLAEPVSIILFSDSQANVQSESTRDGKALMAFLDKNEGALRTISRSAGYNGAVERIQLSLQTLGSVVDSEGKIPGRKLLIWTSPGWPILSGPGVQLSNKNQEGLFNSIVGFSTRLRRADVTLYNVDPLGTADAGGFRTFYYQDFLKGVTAAKHTDPGDLAVQVLAYQSGGRVLNSGNDIAGEIASCVQDANAFYVLSFDSVSPDGPNEYHALAVKIDKGGLTARTHTGYYAQP